MRNLLTSFLDQRETIGNLLAPYITGQTQQFAKQPNTNMLLQGAEAAQQPAPPLPAPIDVLQKQVAEVPRAVDPMPTHSTSQAMPAQPPQSKSGGFFNGLSKFGESDFGQRLGDMMLGWGMGGTMQDSLSKGSQMIAAGNQDRKTKKTQFSTAEWLKNKGMDEEEAKYVAGNPQALNAYLVAMRKGVDPTQALQQRKMELEINKLENPQLSPSDQLAREKFEWEKNNGGGTTEYGLAPQYGTDENGNPVIMQLGKNGSAIKTPLPDGVTLSKEPIRVDAGTSTVLLDPITRQQIGVIPKNNAEAAEATADGKAKSEAKAALGGIEQNANQMLATIQSLEDDPKLDGMLGPVSSRMWNVSGDANRVQSKMDQINGQTFLQAFNSLRGGGAITDAEGAKATQAFARLNAAQNPKDYRDALAELRGIVNAGVSRAKNAANGGGSGAPATPPPLTPVNINGYSIKKVQ
ncbi:hypothetical protein [Pseudochrobactrum kiredjianiae]|uniref:Uncharacterized protein n=1 Tax=Pseudochrobactrum kiredjianiae TaxID=386305 RepID=A0ABW3V1C3_9HYPH|nr:hypothetical protein [Pseudochrobactrum kiredjianiae]MDM7852369.1 hypothetical protein [Pseudochrobactrum kiredjianiae]